MNRIQTSKCWAAALLFGAAWSGLAQQLPTPVQAHIAPAISVVGLPMGAGIQAAGSALGALNFGHVSWARDAHTPGIVNRKDKNSLALMTRIGLRLDCSAADA